MVSPQYPSPVLGASLMVSLNLTRRPVLIIGGGTLAALRTFAALDAGATITVICEKEPCDEIRFRADNAQISLIVATSVEDHLPQLFESSTVPFCVCVTDTLLGTQSRSRASAVRIFERCRNRNILVNVADAPELCDFAFPSSHRFSDPNTGSPTSLQIGVMTNGRGCRLSSRIRREIVSSLPKDIGVAVENIGRMRALAGYRRDVAIDKEDADEDSSLASSPNQPVPMRADVETESESRKRRMKWVAQISEYWSLRRLSSLSEAEMNEALSDGLSSSSSSASEIPLPNSLHNLTTSSPDGRILLVGSGPGHPSLLTVAAHTALTKAADLILSDKLVPEQVLALIPSHVEVRIARKFPGNADGAQTELMEMAVDAAREGRTVIRLKQGDPAVYGRMGEEVLYFRSQGFEPLVIPGVSSALAGPMFAGIPVTQRGVAESFMVCTGVGRKGKEIQLPGYERSRTLIVLMGVARLSTVVAALTTEEEGSHRSGAAYPLNTPVAIIERAAMPDQRVLFSTLRDIEKGLDSLGEQRPPGMILLGWASLCLWDHGDVDVLESSDSLKDDIRIKKWLGSSPWRVVEGYNTEWASFL